MDSTPWLRQQRTVRFGDTDAAGVMHFHQLLRWCHEAYEESLEHYGIPPRAIFPTPEWAHAPESPASAQTPNALPPVVALPIIHCRADFRRPLICGDALVIQLRPERRDPGCFEVVYTFTSNDLEVATGLTRHLAIVVATRQRCALPTPINRWLEASSLGVGVRPL